MAEHYPKDAEHGKYGPIATQLGLAALAGAQALADKPEWHGSTYRRWLPSDRLAFRATIDCVAKIRAAQMAVEAPPKDQLSLAVRFETFHTSLPFSEGERQAFINGFAQHVRRSSHPGRLHKSPLPMIDGGRHRVPLAGDLLDAWWAWRRSVLEFEGQEHIYDYAKGALQEIGRILVPNAVELLPDYRPVEQDD